MSLARPTEMQNGRLGQVVHFAFVKKRPPLSATAAIADAFRAAALSALHIKVGANDSFLLSGHNADGTPDKENRHAYYLPVPDADDSQSLNGVLVVSPLVRFSDFEMAALRTIRTLRWNGPSTKVPLELVDTDDVAVESIASHWKSTTPYVPHRRFWGTHGKHHLVPEKQLETELRKLGLPEVKSVELQPWCKMRIRYKARIAEYNSLVVPIRLGYRVRFSVSQPIRGPVALGHSCHFGLGQFLPAPDA